MGDYSVITEGFSHRIFSALAILAACHGGQADSDLEATRQATGPRPDLTVEMVAGPYSAAPNSIFDVQVVACNRGDSYEYGQTVDVVLSLDNDLSSNNIWLGSGSTGDLDVGACDALTIPVSSGMTPGSYILGAIVDPSDSVTESDETNNALAGDTVLLGTDPELRVTAVSAPLVTSSGNNFQTRTTVCNHGQSGTYSSADVRVLLSTDQDIDPMSDYHVTSMSVGSLDMGACQTLDLDSYAGVPDGTYYLGVVVDPDNHITELDDSNNAHGEHRMGVGSRPEIVVTAASSPLTVGTSGAFEASLTACNHGTSDAMSVSFEAYLSSDDDISDTDHYAGSAHFSGLQAGTCRSAEIPSSAVVSPGLYRFGIIADPQDMVSEFFDDNNVFVGAQVGVGDSPELLVTAIDSPVVAQQYEHIDIPVTVCNRGQTMSYGTQVELRLSHDQDPATYNEWLGSRSVPELQPDECTTVDVGGSLSGSGGLVYPIATVDPGAQVMEIMEGNNQLMGQVMGVGIQSELVITDITSPHSTQSGQQMEVLVTACNIGFAASGYAHIDVVLSNDENIDLNTDHPLGTNSFHDLQPDECTTLPVPGHPSVPNGAYTIGASINHHQTASEILYSNNNVAGDRIGVGPESDIAIASISAPTTARQSHNLDVAVEVCNYGQSDSHGGHVSVVLSDDSTIDQLDSHLGGRPVDTLSPGQCSTVTVPAHVTVPNGLYTIGAIATSSSQELITDNNNRAGHIIGISDDPDLHVTAVSGPDTSLPHDTFNAEITLCNSGQSLSSYSHVELYLSPDNQLSMDDQYAGTVSFSDLAPGQCSTVQHPANGADSGEYRLIANVDPSDSIPEVFEDNNLHVGASIVFGTEPDLTIARITSPITASPSSNANIDVEVCNRGQGASVSSDLNLLLSQDDTLDQHDDPIIGSQQVGSLAIDECVVVTVNTYLGSESGVYRIGGIVDMHQMQSELREGNNTLVGDELGIGTHPDLLVVALAAPPSADPYNGYQVDVEVCNHGQDVSSHSDVELFRSSDGVLDAQDAPIGMSSIGYLAQGACTTVQVYASSSGDHGRYTLIAKVDPYNSIQEINDGNNEFTGAVIRIGTDPDLTIASITAPASAIMYSPFNVDIELCNHGQSTSYSNDLEVYLSNDADINTQDLPVGSQHPGQLDSGQCTFVTVSAHASDIGTFYVGVIADPYNHGIELDKDNNSAVAGAIAITP